jgi:TonB family protein
MLATLDLNVESRLVAGLGPAGHGISSLDEYILVAAYEGGRLDPTTLADMVSAGPERLSAIADQIGKNARVLAELLPGQFVYDSTRRTLWQRVGMTLVGGRRVSLVAAGRLSAQGWVQAVHYTTSDDASEGILRLVELVESITFDRGYDYYREVEEAIASYRKALELDSTLPEVHFSLGFALRQKGQLEPAIASFLRAIELRPDYGKAHLYLGFSLEDQERWDEALPSFEAAVRYRPADPSAHMALGDALSGGGRLDEAIASYRTALELKPNFPEVLYNLGLAQMDNGQLDGAITSFRRAVELSPDEAFASFAREGLNRALSRRDAMSALQDTEPETPEAGVEVVVDTVIVGLDECPPDPEGRILSDADAGRVFPVAVVDCLPEMLSCSASTAYDPSLGQGQVVLQFVIDTLGVVEPGNVEVIEGVNPALDSLALEMIRSCRFRPGRLVGRAVRVRVQMPWGFGVP